MKKHVTLVHGEYTKNKMYTSDYLRVLCTSFSIYFKLKIIKP